MAQSPIQPKKQDNKRTVGWSRKEWCGQNLKEG